VGGRTALGFENDVWLWTYSGAFCTLPWEGIWKQLTAAAAWPPRHGHSMVGFPSEPGSGVVDTVLVIGGFGGNPNHEVVSRLPVKDPIMARNDLWCGNQKLGNFREWTEIAPTAPYSERAQAAAVVAPTLGPYALIFFGGYDRSARFVMDSWRWVGENATAACRID